MKITERMIEMLHHDFKNYAGGEPIENKFDGCSFYAFTTELGALRIYAKYHLPGYKSPKNLYLNHNKVTNKWFVSFRDLDLCDQITQEDYS